MKTQKLNSKSVRLIIKKENRKSIDLEREIKNFAKAYLDNITVIVPSSDKCSKDVAEIVKQYAPNAKYIEGPVCRITAEEVSDVVLNGNSKFREYYKSNFNEAYQQLGEYLTMMNEKYQGLFVRNYIDDPQMRSILDATLKSSDKNCAEFAKQINDQNILIIDDVVNIDTVIRGVWHIINCCYNPETLFVLTIAN